MKTQTKALSLTFALLSLCCSLQSARAEEPADIKATMRRNFEALMNLQQYVADPNAFTDPKNHDAIQKNLDAMSGLGHVFSPKMAGQEPGLAAISGLFSEYLEDVQRSFKEGASPSLVRNRLRTMTGFCLSCHTRVGTNQAFADLQHKVDSLKLTDFQKAEFYAATRQFDKAVDAFDKVISTTPAGEVGYIELNRAVREALSVTVRVKQDPKATFLILEKLASREDLPDFFRRYVVQWKKDVVKWMQEKRRPKNLPAEVLMARARAMVGQGTTSQLFAADPSGDVSFLRATNLIHEALQKDPNGKFRGEALYLLGSCYDALQDPLLWALDSMYFEACVREFPHTPIAKKCYWRYSAKLYFGYSGSGGTFVPEDELKKLAELRKLSH